MRLCPESGRSVGVCDPLLSSLFFCFRLKEHVQDPSNNPILIFPEGAYEGEKEWGEGRGVKAKKDVLSLPQSSRE